LCLVMWIKLTKNDRIEVTQIVTTSGATLRTWVN
jgi:hypothetical protein